MERNWIIQYRQEIYNELKGNILPFWINNVTDRQNGGYYGRVSNDLRIDKKADKGCILNSRILWTYASAYRLFKDESYLKAAEWAYNFLVDHFWDKENSALYWKVDYQGSPVDTKKQIYNIAFGIYALSEYYSASGVEESLDRAIELFEVVEKYSYDVNYKGYIEALTREWNAIEDMRLSEKELNSKKTMNTHLHILEAYTNLFRVWKSEKLRRKLEELINVTVDYIIDNKEYQFKLFFDEKWNSLSKSISYGHDIEGSWLLYEAAEVLGNEELIEKVREISIKMAEKVYQDGIDREHGGIIYEKHEDGSIDYVKAWWPQAEAMVGFINTCELTGDEKFLKEAYEMWQFVDRFFVDKKYGEWFNEISRNGQVDGKMAKVDFWKCPYHNARACFEIIARLDKMVHEG